MQHGGQHVKQKNISSINKNRKKRKRRSKFGRYPSDLWEQTIMLKTIVSVLILIGCNNNIYISKNCTDNEVGLIELSVEKLNETYTDVNVIVAGRSDETEERANETDLVICEHNEDEYYEMPKGVLLGYERNGDIVIYSHLIDNDDRWQGVFMHELGHFIGMDDLYNDLDKGKMMYYYTQNPPVLEY